MIDANTIRDAAILLSGCTCRGAADQMVAEVVDLRTVIAQHVKTIEVLRVGIAYDVSSAVPGARR